MTNSTPVPAPSNPESLLSQFEAFVQLVRILRAECPWDRKQNHGSLAPMLVEEAYEAREAIDEGNDDEFSRELGDLLLHIVMHGVLAEERGAFTLTDVLAREFEKLVHRHPHVFGEGRADNAGQVQAAWNQLKMREGRQSVLEGLPRHLPALLRAQSLQERAATQGFDWDDKADVWDKVAEELREFREAKARGNTAQSREEFGDLLFALVNAARFENIIAEDALQLTNNKFIRRFQYIERSAAASGRTLQDMTLAEMDEYWNRAKAEERTHDGTDNQRPE